MIRVFKTRGTLLREGWSVEPEGLVKGPLFFPRQLEFALGSERRVSRWGKDWRDEASGFSVPDEVLESTGPEPWGCSCGAKYTSLPQLHSDWCSNYKEKQHVKDHNHR